MAIKRHYVFDKTSQRMVEVSPGWRPDVDAPYVQIDEIPPTASPLTGEVYTSRQKLYEHYRENGYECTGGSHLTGKGVADFRYKANREEIRAEVEKQYNRVKWGMAPMTEREREVCQREERNYQEYKRRQRY